MPKALLVHNETDMLLKNVRTNGELLEYARQCQSVVVQCNYDKDAIGKLR